MPVPLHHPQLSAAYATYAGGSAPRGVGPIAPATGTDAGADVRHAG